MNGLGSRIAATGLTKRFGGLVAVDGVSLRVEPGEIVGLIGPNGAGKTTLFDLLSGVLKPDAGRLAVDGIDVSGASPHRLAQLGLVRTFQLSRELDSLTVLENVALAAPHQLGETLTGALLRPWRTRSGERSVVARARDLLALVSLSVHEAKPAASLSGGQKKLLELARCLMAGAHTILLDEVAAGVAPPVVEDIAKLVLALNQQGTTFVVIEHNIGVIRRLASRVIVLAGGRVLAEGSFAEVSSNPDVVASYLGQAA